MAGAACLLSGGWCRQGFEGAAQVPRDVGSPSPPPPAPMAYMGSVSPGSFAGELSFSLAKGTRDVEEQGSKQTAGQWGARGSKRRVVARVHDQSGSRDFRATLPESLRQPSLKGQMGKVSWGRM